MYLSPFLSLYLYLFLSLFIYICFSLSLFIFVSLSLYLYLFLSLCLFIFVSLSLYLYFFLSLFIYICFSSIVYSQFLCFYCTCILHCSFPHHHMPSMLSSTDYSLLCCLSYASVANHLHFDKHLRSSWDEERINIFLQSLMSLESTDALQCLPIKNMYTCGPPLIICLYNIPFQNPPQTYTHTHTYIYI